MRKLLIIGGDGIGLIAADVAETNKTHQILGFLNDTKPHMSLIGKFKKYPVLGGIQEVHKFIKDPEVVFL